MRTLAKKLMIGEVEAAQVLRFRERHRLGMPAELEVDFHLTSYIPVDDMVGHPAMLEVEHENSPPRTFVGIVESASAVASSFVLSIDRTHVYTIRVVSVLALLERSFGCRIFQELDVKEIVTQTLETHGIAAGSFEWRLIGSYAKREFCVQYQESALAFVSRLLEEEGIYFFSEYPDGAEKIVFCDDSTGAEPIEGDPRLVYRGRTGMTHDDDCASSVAERRRVVSGKFVVRDFNFDKPELDLTSDASSDVDTDLEVYDYPGRYFEPEVGKARATVKLEAEQAARATLVLEGTSTRIRAGRMLELADAGDADGKYLVTSVELEHAEADDPKAKGAALVARAELLPLAVKYRSPIVTPKPLIHGPQTAVIVAPSGASPEEIHTDKRGCCKVKFHWDTADVHDDKASCWMRVEQLQTSGSMVLPRVDWEFLVEFLEGDPDRPLVAGRLYNGSYMPPYALPEGKTRTSLSTASTPGGGGRNEIRFEDKSGSEEVMIHAQYDTNIAVANNKTKTVGNNEAQSIGVNNTVQVGADQTVKITKGSQNTVGSNQTVSVGGNRNYEVNAAIGLTVKGSATSDIGGNEQAMIGNPLEAALALAAEKAAEIAAAKAGEALAKVESAVQGSVNQAMAPVDALTAKAQSLGGAMNAVKGGDMSAVGGLMAGAAGLPTAGAMGSALGGGPSGGLAATTTPAGQGSTAAGVSGGNLLSSMAQTAIQKGMGKAKKALSGGKGAGGGDGGGESGKNFGGNDANVAGVDATDREKGPGHDGYKITGSHKEKVGSLKVVAAASGVMTNVAAKMDRNVGAAHVEIVAGDRAESVEGLKKETALGLIVISRSDETVKVSGAHTTMVGGAVIQKISGGHSVTAGAPATFIGAFHKIEASGKITLKCGGSEIVIDGSGITMKSVMITITAGKIHMPKSVAEVV